MPDLDLRGKIAAAQLAFYVPVAVLCFVLVIRYGFRRDAGWFFMFLFALTRIAGGAVLIAAEMVVPSNVDLFIAAYVLFPAGLALLLLSTIGFLGLAGQHTFSEVPRVTATLRFLGFLTIVALALVIAGCILGTHVSPNNGNTGKILRQVGAVLYGVVYLFLFIAHFTSCSYRYELRSYRRNLLTGITIALPFLGVRVAYAILSAWSSEDLFGTIPSSNPILAKFNPITGDWIAYLVMGLIMEYCVVAIDLFSSTVASRRY